MEQYLASSITFNIVISAAIALIMAWFYFKRKSKPLIAWTIGWALYAVSLAFDLWAVMLGVPTNAIRLYPHLAFVRFVTAGIAFSFWYFGISLLVSDKKSLQSQLTGWLIGGSVLWSYFASYVLYDFFLLSFGICTVLSAAVLLLMAWCFNKYRRVDRSIGPVMLIAGTLGLAVTQAMHPFAQEVDLTYTFIFTLCAAFKILIGVGFFLIMVKVPKIAAQRKASGKAAKKK